MRIDVTEPQESAEDARRAGEIWDALRGCRGEDMAITGPQIAAALDIPERRVRRLIAAHFQEWAQKYKIVLLSKPGKGFFLATDAEQIQRDHVKDVRLMLAQKDRLHRKEQMARAAGFGGVLTGEAAA